MIGETHFQSSTSLPSLSLFLVLAQSALVHAEHLPTFLLRPSSGKPLVSSWTGRLPVIAMLFHHAALTTTVEGLDGCTCLMWHFHHAALHGMALPLSASRTRTSILVGHSMPAVSRACLNAWGCACHRGASSPSLPCPGVPSSPTLSPTITTHVPTSSERPVLLPVRALFPSASAPDCSLDWRIWDPSESGLRSIEPKASW